MKWSTWDGQSGLMIIIKNISNISQDCQCLPLTSPQSDKWYVLVGSFLPDSAWYLWPTSSLSLVRLTEAPV